MKGIIAFVLIAFGTLGLILNEFLFTMGTSAVLVFSLSNVIGLVTLYFELKKEQEKKGKNEL